MAKRHTIAVADKGDSFQCREDQNLLQGLAFYPGGKGFQAVIPVGCRGGGCGVCRIQVLTGNYTAKKMSRKHVTAEEIEQGLVLACRVQPLSDMRVSLAAQQGVLDETARAD